MMKSQSFHKLHARLAATLLLVAATATGCDNARMLGATADVAKVSEIRSALASESAGEGGAAAESSGTGWGTIKGRFVLAADAEIPSMAPYGANKDGATCAPGGQAPLQETLLVDSASRGIRNIAVYARKVGRVHESAEVSADPIDFDQKKCVFLTHVIACGVGQTLNLMNSDPVGHNTNIAGRKNTFNQTIPAGESIPFIPQKEETTPAPVSCSIHPWMIAYLLPRENGYFSVTGEDGSFEIANLPAGEEVEIQVWHESATGPGSVLVVNSAEAKELGWTKKGRFSVKLQPDETKEVEVVVPASAFRS